MATKKSKPAYKADGGKMGAPMAGGIRPVFTPRGVGGMERPMPAMPRMKPAAPAAPRSRMAMMSNGGKAGGKAKKGC